MVTMIKGVANMNVLDDEASEEFKKEFLEICKFNNSKKGIIDTFEFEQWCDINNISEEARKLFYKSFN